MTSKHLQLALLLLLVFPLFSMGAKKDNSEKKETEEKGRKEALEKRLAEEKEIKAQFEYSFNDVSDRIVTVSCENSKGRSSGSAFIATMDGETYLFTNQHVILGADKISFKTATGRTLRPLGVQLSSSLDIARLPLDEAEGFAITKNMAMDAPIAVFGNSEGGGVATELYGKITGVGADVIEVSADFVSGNSGSPVLNLDHEVIGIASYVSWKTSGKSDTVTRRFCYRLTNSKWISVNWKKYNDKYGKLHQENTELIDSIFEIANVWYTDPFNRVLAEDHPDAGLRNWSTEHNHMINRIGRQREKGHATTHELANINKQIRKDMNDSAEDLSAVCKNRARQMHFLATQKGLTEYLRNDFENLAERLENAAYLIEVYGTELSKRDFFHFK
ncbi:MAG: serine protease [Pontiella sp.]